MRGPAREDELEAFKTQIDIREYMASRGYTLDQKISSRSYSVMRHANGDKCIVTRKANRHWIYANAHDARDQGTIICFVQNRGGGSIGEVRKELRPWIGKTGQVVAAQRQQYTELLPSQHDAARVLTDWENANLIRGFHDYLEQQRRIPGWVLGDPVFADRLRTDDRHGNVLFAHFNTDGLCGFEIKNQGFTGFSTGGVKGLFCSRPRADDRELVACETAIDAVSFASLFGTNGRRFVSTAGQISPAQKSLLQSAARKMPSGSSIVLAMDNDCGGRKIVQTITQALEEIDLGGKAIVTRLPTREGDDWNDVLRRGVSCKAAFPAPG